jgi:hypothetical protein
MIGKDSATALVSEEELLRLVLQGFTLRECAQYMRAGYSRIRRIAKQPEFLLKLREHSAEIGARLVDEISRTQLEFTQRLEVASEEALDQMLELMKDPAVNQNTRFRAAQDLMDRDVRSSKTQKVQAHVGHEFINPAVLLHAAATAKELDRALSQKGELPSLNGDNTSTDGNTGHTTDSGNG